MLTWAGPGTRRDLPWRRTRDPWAVLVSEVMLQQTQVSRVTPIYDRFLQRFPRPDVCAAAGVGEVVRLWEGLGYNRRAVRLHGAAVAIGEHHGGRVPDRIEDLLALPGVGAYTARAVLAFAYDQPAGVVDTNVARVLARAVAGRSLTGRELQPLADALVPPDDAWRYNQALLDLGALVCRKRAPACARCPVAAVCRWQQAGSPEPDPAGSTAGVSGSQSRFDGSDRQGRGRLVTALRGGPIAWDRIPAVAGWPGDPGRAHRVATDLVSEGLAVRRAGELRLPS